MINIQFLCLLGFLLLTHCQTPIKEGFEKVKLGMHKGDVLELLGNPATTSRRHGADRWYYYLEREHRRKKRVLYFVEGIVSYKGPLIPPKITADEVDLLKQPAEPLPKPYKRSLTDQQLKKIIKKAIKDHNKTDGSSNQKKRAL